MFRCAQVHKLALTKIPNNNYTKPMKISCNFIKWPVNWCQCLFIDSFQFLYFLPFTYSYSVVHSVGDLCLSLKCFFFSSFTSVSLFKYKTYTSLHVSACFQFTLKSYIIFKVMDLFIYLFLLCICELWFVNRFDF